MEEKIAVVSIIVSDTAKPNIRHHRLPNTIAKAKGPRAMTSIIYMNESHIDAIVIQVALSCHSNEIAHHQNGIVSKIHATVR